MKEHFLQFHPERQLTQPRAVFSDFETTYLCFNPDCGKKLSNRERQRHHGHPGQYMDLEKAMDLMEELLLNLRQRGASRVGKSAQVIEKFILLEQFKVHLDRKWEEIQNELYSFLNSTETLIHQYNQTKRNIQAHLNKLEEPKTDINFLFQEYQVKEAGKLQLKNKQLRQLDQQWRKNIMKLVDDESQFKQYAMKTIQIITDCDYDIEDQKTKGEVNKFSQLHQQLKAKLENKFRDGSTDCQSTRLDRCNSSRQSLRSSAKENVVGEYGLSRKNKKKAESQARLTKMRDWYQMK